MWWLYFRLLRNHHTLFHSVYTLSSHPQCTRVPISLYLYQNFLSFVFCFFITTILTSIRLYLMVVLIYISLMINDIEHLLTYLLSTCTSIQIVCSFCFKKENCVIFLLLSCTSFLHILNINKLLDIILVVTYVII